MKIMLHAMIPDDTIENETQWHTNIVTSPFKTMEIEKTIKNLGNEKSPQYDLIVPKMVR